MWYLNVETLLGNQSPPEHVIWCKNDGDMSFRLLSRACQEITKLKKNYTIKVWPLYFTLLPGGSCWADCSRFLRVGYYPRRNHVYQILSRSHRGLRSYGGPRPRPFSRFFFTGFGDIATMRLRTNFEVSVCTRSSLYLYSFSRYVRVYAKIYGGHVT